MSEVVVHWAAVKFQSTRISTMVNPVRWATPERVLNYWQNTTFYSADHRPNSRGGWLSISLSTVSS